VSGFSIKRPDAKRRTFSVHRKIYRENLPPQQPKLVDERIEAINSQFLAGTLDEQSAWRQIKQVIESIKEKEKLPDHLINKQLASEDNEKLFKALWKRKYEKNRKILRKHTAMNEFKYAINALGDCSLFSIEENELIDLCHQIFLDHQHKRYVGRINSLLAQAKRGFKLKTKKPEKTRIRYVTWDEFIKIRSNIEDVNLRNLYTTLFVTGVRLGEAFTIDPDKVLKGRPLPISTQLTESLIVRQRKNKVPYEAIILEFGFEAVRQWANLDFKIKQSYRKRCQHPLIKIARKLFPNEPLKQISPHDLRHSYCMHLLGQGVNITQVSKLIGDTVRTVESHYSDLIQSKAEYELVLKLLNQKSA
jgi:integrase